MAGVGEEGCSAEMEDGLELDDTVGVVRKRKLLSACLSVSVSASAGGPQQEGPKRRMGIQ
jgi:hypothetical protein